MSDGTLPVSCRPKGIQTKEDVWKRETKIGRLCEASDWLVVGEFFLKSMSYLRHQPYHVVI
ncbi:hypothetical protein TRM7615_00965 [Falsiruegeria mediterranea M17]|uniref:Uncharacterized protein n=1 Tax=Falsiruegeria mediterranea M17 TaxID=1200281 RepID=A0A2R8C4X3_9RHOB|nr:hypothetical protein TRM7615_00965 [Falsiruegeria mediterranea M17]